MDSVTSWAIATGFIIFALGMLAAITSRKQGTMKHTITCRNCGDSREANDLMEAGIAGCPTCLPMRSWDTRPVPKIVQITVDDGAIYALLDDGRVFAEHQTRLNGVWTRVWMEVDTSTLIQAAMEEKR